jgi:hypothetical protein
MQEEFCEFLSEGGIDVPAKLRVLSLSGCASSAEWGDLSYFVPMFGLEYAYFESRLQPQPELLRRSEEFREPDRSVGGNPAPLQNDVIHSRGGDV